MESIGQSNNLKLYNNIINSKKATPDEIGDFDTFNTLLKDSANVEKLYNNLIKLGRFSQDELGTKDEFFANIDPIQPVQPVQDAGVQKMTSSAQPEREKGFWNTYAGDALEKLGEGTAWLGEGIGRFANMPAKILAGTIANNEGLAPEAKQAFSKLLVASSPMAGDLEMSADALKRVQKGLAEKSDRYQGKDFSQLWKEGNKTGAIGQIMLEATRSLPISITAGLTGGAGLGLIGGVSAGQKYEELSDSTQPGEQATTKEWEDYKSRMNMNELAKVSNAILSGASEAGSEFLGSVPVVSWLGRIYQKAGKNGVQDVVKNGVKTTVEKLFDKYGILAAPVVEGIEEYSNQVAQNTVDYITGSRADFKPFENADKAFVYGAGGGAQFSAATIPGVIANQFTGKEDNQSPVPENQVPQPDPDQQRNAMIEQMRYRMQNIAHESGELVTVMDDFGNTLFVKSGDLDDPSGLVQVVDKTGQPAGNNGFMHVSKIREHAHMPLEQALQERIPIIDKIIRDSKLPKVGAQISYQNKPFTITQDLGESFILENEKEEPVEVLKDEFLSKEEIPEQASVPNPIVSVPFGKQSYDFTKNDDGSFNFVPSEKMPPEKALTQLQKEFEKNPDWEVTTEKEEQEVPAANIFQRPTKQTVIKNISVRPKNIQNATQVPGGDNNMSGNEVSPEMQEQVEADTAPAYQFNGKDVSKDYVQGVIEDAQTKEDLVGLTYRNDPDIDAMIEKKFPAPKTIYRIGKKEVPRDRALARIDRAKNREQLEELKIENDPEMQQAYNSKLAEFQKQADQVQAENNRKHDKLVGMMQSYNQSSPAERRRINTAPMMQLASELGYNVKYENGSGVRIFKNGTEIRRNADRLGNEEIQSHRLLSDYDDPVQKLAGSLMLPANIEGVEVGTMQPREISQAILDVQAGRKTVLSNQLLDEIEKIHSSGVVRLKGDRNTGYPGMEIPLEDFVSLINGEGTDKEREMASMIPENIVESINSQITVEDLDRYSKLIPIIYGNEQEQSTATERTDTGTVESLPESEELRQDENAEREVQKEVETGSFSEKENQKLTETEEQNAEQQNVENIQQAESLPKNEISGEKLNKEPGQIQQPGQQTEDAQKETGGKRKQKDLEVKTPLEKALEKAEVRTKIKDEERRVNPSPTEGQKEAGNYQKGHVKVQGFDISIENPKGSMRSGTDATGKKWEQKLNNSYGYFRRTEGYDGDQIDVFLGSNPASEKVFVVDQNKPGTEEFDESKTMLGFDNAEQAKDAYMSNYESGWTGFGAITEVPAEDFRKWLYDGARQRKPFSEYKGTPDPVDVQKENDNFEENRIYEKRQNYKTKEGQEIQYTLQFSDHDNRTSPSELQRKDNSRQTPSLRRLKPGEFSSVEMKYTADKNFIFDGRNKIESPDDVAFLFRQLENKSVENMFAALIDENGKPTILHISMGGRAGTVIDFGVMTDAVHRFKPKKIYLIHNHPSGNLQYSEADMRTHTKAREAFGENLVGEHIIIDTTSGEYATFTTQYDYHIKARPTKTNESVNYRVLKFDKQVFKERTELPASVTQSSDVAKFLSAQRFTTSDKQSVLLLGRNLNILAYLHISSTDFASKESVEGLIKELQAYVGRFGAQSVILTGKLPDIESTYEYQQKFRNGIRRIKSNLEKIDVRLQDYVSVKSDLNYSSLADEGLMEPKGEYKSSGKPKYLNDFLDSKAYIPEKITIDGIDRPTKNSEGKLIHPSVTGIKNFWRWFSDSDKAKRIEKLRKSQPIKITGNEITPSDDLKEYKKNALEYGKKLQGEYINKDTGATVMLQRGRRNGGINEVLQHDYKDVEHLQSIAAIPQIIENGIYIDSRENDNKEKNPDVARYDYYVSGLMIGNVDYTVRSSIAIDTRGNRYYDHKLTQIEKRKLLDSLSGITTPGFNQAVYNGFGTTPGTKPTTEYKDKKLLDLLQVRSSKGVDDQGRPLVVYHGTNADFTEFIPNRRGIWLTPDKSRAQGYAMMKANGNDGIVMPLYAKIENPAPGEYDDQYNLYSDTGHDGWISRKDNGEPFTIVVKSPSQIKSATGNQGTFDESNPDIRFRNVSPSGFYSTEENALDQISQNNGTPLFTTKGGGVRFTTIDGLLKSNDLKKYFYKLFANAKNSGTIHVVENYNEVPEGFREKAKENKAFGFYDPNTGKSYFITGRIGSADQAFKTWVHEVGAHKGLSNIIPEHQLNPLFEKIVDDLGEEEINKVLPEEYRDLGKAERGEEYLAYLTEKVITEKDLKPVEKTIWQKILDRVKDILNKVFNTKEPFTVKDAEDIIRAAVQSVYQAPQSIVDLNNIEALNDQFNTELQRQINGTLKKGHTYQLGFPSSELKSAGIPDLPIELRASRLSDKSMQENHPFDLSEVKDLLKAIQKPLAVFRSATHIGSYVVLTELEHRGKNYVVAIEVNRNAGKIEVNSVRSVHYRSSNAHIPNWIEEGLLEYADKTKMSEWISKQRYNSADVRNLFRRATKIIEDFENNNIRFRKSDPEKPKTLHGLLMTPAGERYREGIKEKRSWKQTLQGFRDYTQEKDGPIRRWQDDMVKLGAKLKENANPFRDKKLAPGRLQTLSKQFETKMEPVLKTIAKIVKTGISMEWMEPYLIAKHTPEVNAKIRAQKLEEFKNRNFNLARWIEKNDPTEVELQEKIAELRQKELYPSEDEIAEMKESLADVDFAGILPLNEDRDGNIIDERYKNDPDGFANALVKDFEGMVDKELLTELHDNLKVAADAILDAQVNSRMITQKQSDDYRSMYQNYVPLRGWREDAAKYYTYTRGKSGQGSSVKHAEGRSSLAESPLSYIFKLGHKSLAEQVENEVRESLLRFIANNYSPEFREMYKVKSAYFVKDGIDPETGDEVWRITTDRPSKEQFESGNAVSEFYYDHMKLRTYQHALEHEVVVHTKDGDVVVVFDRRYPSSLPVAQAFNNQNVMFNLPGAGAENANLLNTVSQHKIPFVNKSLREFTNWMKQMFTQFNLKFPITNFSRDIGESNYDSYILFGHGISLGQNKRAYIAVDRYLRGKEIGELAPELTAFYENGGTTGYTHELTPEEYEKQIAKEVKSLLKDGKVHLTLKYLSRWLTRYNQRFEDSVRFAVYLNARAEGLSVKDSCYRSRNATVDFNIRGKGSPWLGTIWGFFEVAVNSLAKNSDYFTRLGKTARKRAIQVAAAHVIVGFMEAMLNDWAYSDGDDDKDDDYYNRSRWMRHNYLNIPLPGDTKLYIPIALPQFWRGFKGMGAMFYDYFIGQRGKLGAGEAAGGIGLNFVDALFPVPITSIYQNGEFHPEAPFVPLILKPLYEIRQNRNFMGQQIYKEPFTKKQEKDIADSSLYKENVNTAYKFFTDLLARTAGKDNDSRYYVNKQGKRGEIAGILDLNPSKIEHVVSGYLGGTGDFVSDIITTAGQLINPDEDFDFKNAPFLNAFIRKTPEAKWNIIREYNQLKDYIEGMDTQESNYMKMAETGDKQALDKLKSLKLNNYDQSYAVLLEFYDNQISELSKYVDYLTGDGTDPVIEKMKEAIDQINELKFKNKKQ